MQEAEGRGAASTAGWLPDDLRVCCGGAELWELVCSTIEGLRPCGNLPQGWTELARLLTYHYATGIYPSREIAAAAQEQHLFPSATFPGIDESSLRRFRREHRRELARCLGQVLARSWTRQSHRSLNLEPARPGSFPDFPSEAEARISKAVRLDCWEADL